jgi:hypothetical protein
MIVLGVQENVRVGNAVRPGLPIGELLLMALAAAATHFLHVVGTEAHVFGDFAAQMVDQPTDVFQMQAGIEREHVAVTTRTRHVTVG